MAKTNYIKQALAAEDRGDASSFDYAFAVAGLVESGDYGDFEDFKSIAEATRSNGGLGTSFSTANRRMKVGAKLNAIGVTKAQIKATGAPFMSIARATPVLDEKNWKEWAEKAKKSTYRDFEQEVKTALVKAGGGRQRKSVTISGEFAKILKALKLGKVENVKRVPRKAALRFESNGNVYEVAVAMVGKTEAKEEEGSDE